MKPPSFLDSNSCEFLASKRLVTYAASLSPAAFEKGSRQRHRQLGLGKGALGTRETQVSFCLNFSQAIRTGRKDVWVVVSRGELRGTPVRPPQTPVTLTQMPHPHCESPGGSAPASCAQPRRPSSSSPGHSNTDLSSFPNPEVPSRDEPPGQGPGESREDSTGDRGGPRGAESAGC